MKNNPLILAIETSCDETSVAITKGRQEALADLVSSQIDLHAKYGGVVPEVAARQHVQTIIPLLKEAQDKARIKLSDLDAIAVVNGPGLITSLIVGVDTAKALAWALQKPLITVNHLEAHIYSNFIGQREDEIIFPALCLIVSGGHTELVLMENHGRYKIIGQTRDDAAGEAFDKVARLLNLGFPGGPAIARLADLGNSKSFQFSRPMLQNPDFDFSFSGLKTEVLRLVSKKNKFTSQELMNICASFQAAVVDTLVAKTLRAAEKFDSKTVMIAGGVSANRSLRRKLELTLKNNLPKVKFIKPAATHSTDNALMVAEAAYRHFLIADFADGNNIKVEPNLTL